MRSLPLAALETIFLDAGNTLVSVDFERVAGELAALGFATSAALLQRAEAAARPLVSARLATRVDGDDFFSFYLQSVLERVPEARGVAPDRLVRLATALGRALHAPGHADRLWRTVLPGVPEALRSLRSCGLRLVVVSNSDGSVERGLVAQGLRDLLDEVIDSQVVGYEKPDPRIFAAALSVSAATPEATLHVGDLYSADVVGARAAGVHALLLDPYDDWGGVDCARAPDVLALAHAVYAAKFAAGK